MALSEAQQQEIDALRQETAPTRRAVVPALEEILYQPFPLLDHGFLRVIDYMGDDTAIVQAARISYGKGTKKINQDQGLINYLMRHRHTTPFEMCEIKFHAKMPIFVARDWIRHRTANVNEYSGRYSILGKEFYIPAHDQVCGQSTTNRQGRSTPLNDQERNRVLEILEADARQVYGHYEEMLNADEEGNLIDPNRSGLARELARMNLTLNYYTEWYWKIDLHNFLHFLSLRADSHAQYEIQVYAHKMLEILKLWLPYTYEAFMRYKFNGMHLSEQAIDVVKKVIRGEKVTQESSGMSAREWREFLEQLNLEEQAIAA
jgi:thymidylate synthase (FAD)